MAPETVGKERRPVIAGLFALLGPGLGHLYCGNLRAAATWAIAAICVGNLFYALLAFWDAPPYNVLLPSSLVLLFGCFQITHAWRTASRGQRDVPLHACSRWYWYLTWWLSVVIIAGFSLSWFINYRTFEVTSSSMENSLLIGDRFIADISAYETDRPVRGDVVVFIFPGDRTTKYVFRCMAVSGDTVLVENKTLFINGNCLQEDDYVKHIDTTRTGQQKIQRRKL